jgi:hypothetical protein
MYGKSAEGVMDILLGKIYTYCRNHELPALSALVVGKGRGTPGEADKLYPDLDAERERIYACNWFDIIPPTETDLSNL